MSERSAVQNPMLRYAREIGWEYVPRSQALQMRGGDSGLYFAQTLKDGLCRLNPGVVDLDRAEEILRKLNLLRPNLEGNRDALRWLRGEESVYLPDENRERNVRLVDFQDPDNNVFQVTDEWHYKGAAFPNRADVVFLINGFPVSIAETKAAEKKDGMAEGVEQIRRYHRETPEMMTAPQLFEVTALFKFYYGATWSTSRKSLFNWKDDFPGDYEVTISSFFDRARFLRVLQDYIIFLTKDDQLIKILLRQHQTRGVEKAIERIYDPHKRRGLIWHTQGSGKTLTMITIASKILRESMGSEKPTVLMIVDRTELESQLFKNIKSYGISAQVAKGKRDLRRLLSSDYRGLIVSMIHKFDDIPAEINTRENLVVLVDEAHRSTGGDLGNYLMAALPNATYIGFTGTPIDNISWGKGTFKVFGQDDPQGYLDKYSIAESIADGTTVGLNYALAPSEIRIDPDLLEREFLGLAAAQGISDIDELNAILDRAVELKEMLKSPERVAKVARFIAQHFRENVEPMGFKAFLVAVDRPACAAYKEELDRHLPPEYSQVVYSSAHNDGMEMKRYYLSDDQEKKVRQDFTRKDTLPKILIVTQKLLTGFDAPILYCMYLDKPMRDHVLLQAIARVNRPYEDEDGLVKSFGFVLDFVGIFEKLEKALAFDSDMVQSVIQNIDALKMLFNAYIKEVAREFLELGRGWDDKSKESAIEHFARKEDREDYFAFFRKVQSLYDILSPDAFLRPYMDDYHHLARLYWLIRNTYAETYADKEFTEKTRALLREHTKGGEVGVPGAVHELGPSELKAIRDSQSSNHVKVLNLRKIISLVASRGGDNPVLRLIGERAEALQQAYEDRQMSTQEALASFERLAQECIDQDGERRKLGLDENAYAIYALMRVEVAGFTPSQAEEIDALVWGFPDYLWDEREEGKLRAKIYGCILPLVGKKRMAEVADAIMRLRR